MTPDEVANTIEVLTEIKVYGLKENEHYLDRYNALNSAISLLQDYQKLRVMGGVELNKEIDKIIVEAVNQNLEISEQDKNAGKCLYCPGATQKIIDLCNARLAGKMKGIEKICFDHISIGTSEYYKMLPVNLAGAIVTYLQQPTEPR